ncbi:hypothetical protein F2P81_011122 [Scophthalmus maximus]|uniref:Uncharacterized protein n=1 Tax=Scophthalmus maximus TaxID=52904 RepID=A0A6A4SVA1_SCOMX|nr:hypothetical protein F2P81_011122 [Scophthalmus maximus]
MSRVGFYESDLCSDRETSISASVRRDPDGAECSGRLMGLKSSSVVVRDVKIEKFLVPSDRDGRLVPRHSSTLFAERSLAQPTRQETPAHSGQRGHVVIPTQVSGPSRQLSESNTIHTHNMGLQTLSGPVQTGSVL